MTGRVVLAALFLLSFVAGPRAADAPQPTPSPAAPPAAAEDAGRDALLARLAAASDPDEADGIVARLDLLNQRSGSDTGDLLLARASAALDGKDVDVAQQLLNALTTLRPQWAEAWAVRANADYLAGDARATFVDLARALADDPKHLKAMADLGAMLEDAGKRDEALRVYQQALDLAPHWRPAQAAVLRLKAAVAGESL